MPASIPISSNEKKWFLKLIHEVYGFQIVDSYACQRLSEELLSRSKISISYNTIRRLFGIIKGSNQASRFTLDCISKSLGYSDFSHFQVAVNQLEIDYVNQLLILNRLKKRKDYEIILRIVQDFQFSNSDEIYQLKSIIDLCIDIENYELLEGIFNLEFNLKNEDLVWKLYVSFQSIFIQCKLGNPKMISFIGGLMSTNETAQRVLLQLFVDEDALNTYYGDWIELASIDLVDDMEMFKSLMLIQRAILNKQTGIALSLLERCNLLLSTNEIDFHPILKGRLAAWNYLLLGHKSLFLDIFEELKTVPDQLFCLVFFYRLLVDFEADITEIDLIERFSFDDRMISSHFTQKENLNIYYLLRARYFKQKKYTLEKAQALGKFNPLYKYACLFDWVDKQLAILN
ncbi:MAG: hypothetical protein RLZZ185_1654 [Bacteroidota bacterium]|jgi:hypothetical protein